jgi:protocatechuate 3,4-dioxygenase beta subunit
MPFGGWRFLHYFTSHARRRLRGLTYHMSMRRAILAGSILAAAVFAAQTVEGRVTNGATGTPIAGVRVRLFGMDADHPYNTTTDAQGRFRIDGVKAGIYGAIYDAKGFLMIPFAGDRPRPFAVAAGGDPVRLEVSMQPLAQVSGRVLDGAGRPVPGASVWRLDENRWCVPPACSPSHGMIKTNEKGEYTFPQLIPGPHVLSATAPASWAPPDSRGDERLAWAQTLYPGVADPQLAESVDLPPGGEQWNVDIKLAAAPVHRLSGRVLDPRGNPVPKASVALGKGFGPTLTAETKADGTFEFASVMDSEWRLSSAATEDGVKLKGSQPVEVHGRDLENVQLRLAAPFTLRGRLVLEVPDGTAAPEPPPIDLILDSVTVLLTDDQYGTLPIDSHSAGPFTVADVYPGSYEVNPISDSPAPYYLDSIRLGGQDALGPVPILSDAQTLTITYKLGGGTVRGAVEGCGGGQVLLIPQDPSLRHAGFLRVTGCDANGRFEFPSVRPGEYYGLAFAKYPGTWEQILADAGLLQQAGRVTVRAGESADDEIPLAGR